MSEPNDWLTKSEAAAYLKVSIRQVTRLALPRTFVASSPRYDRADLDEYLRQRKVVPRQQRRRAPIGGPRVPVATPTGDDWLERMKARLRRV
jgi:hypothetical protein